MLGSGKKKQSQKSVERVELGDVVPEEDRDDARKEEGLPGQCQYLGLPVADYFKQWINLKKGIKTPEQMAIPKLAQYLSSSQQSLLSVSRCSLKWPSQFSTLSADDYIVTDAGRSRGKDRAIKALLNLEVPSKTPTHHLLRTRGATV
ncbi:hypothetical protein IHE44_0015017 [Lamprotornis superbus]|uniref:Uncharacterized protein n=1 Tax=Lamprotornis superbus TaxID=245042 RepID=A0A835TY18_9PASS|nr:hypothetical protein IHE44_0015017 [Lamprotornis superbus]